MAAFRALKTGALAVVTGFVTSAVISAGQKAAAAEDAASAAGRRDGESGLAYAPEFDGLECFETIVRTGPHPASGKDSAKAPGISGWMLYLSPQSDGLKALGIVPTRNQPASAKQESRPEESAAPRGFGLAPQFDGLHCFETFISKN